ncbi:hypothetical protein [Sphingomonas sp. UBA978]|uniref:hypothetical protein n=1 Tax=Sphingomonas sp. UBA978 TaxID=1947536 RepID=UPI0025DF6E96|nr:hypothetical protein [Sphingomonas sp. UBA978]
MPRPNPTTATLKPQARTRVGNGSAVLQAPDGRSIEFRRYREILTQLVSDIGGEPSEAQGQIARRAAMLAIWCEQQDAAAGLGTPIDVKAYTTASNTLRRLLETLGIERRARNITPTLSEYAARRAAEKAKAA